MSHLKNVLDGFVSVLHVGPAYQRNYVQPQGGFDRDRASLAGDYRVVGKGLSQAARKHEQQSRQSTRQK